MTIQDVHLLIAQARLEADSPALKVFNPAVSLIGVTEYNSRHTFHYMSA